MSCVEANNIDVHITNGGHDLIQVSDNGCGMNKEDLKLAFTRYATSKIHELEDLNSIKDKESNQDLID